MMPPTSGVTAVQATTDDGLDWTACSLGHQRSMEEPQLAKQESLISRQKSMSCHCQFTDETSSINDVAKKWSP